MTGFTILSLNESEVKKKINNENEAPKSKYQRLTYYNALVEK